MLQFSAKHFLGSIFQRSIFGATSSSTLRQSYYSRTRSRPKRVIYFCESQHFIINLKLDKFISFNLFIFYRYFFSWRDPALKGVEEDWLGARNYCRQRCMDSVSLETSNENEWIKSRLVNEKVDFFLSLALLFNFQQFCIYMHLHV